MCKKLYNDLAIVILNYNEFYITIKCVKKLIDLNLKFKIIIVDNNSSNNSFEILKHTFKKYRNIKIIKTKENKGYAYGNNFGLRYIEKNLNIKYVTIMNPDILILNKDIFLNLINYIELYNLAGITATQITNNYYAIDNSGWKLPTLKDILILNFKILSKYLNPIKYKKINLIDKNKCLGKIDVMPGCFFIMDLKKFKKINYFDERTFLYYEENILAKKCKDRSFEFGISLNDYYIHNHLEKEKKIDMLLNKYNDRKYSLKSQKIYVYNYLSKTLTTKFLLKLSQFFNLYIEFIIIYIGKKCIKTLRR